MMKKLVKKNNPKTITAFIRTCKCSLSKCMSSAKGMGSACTTAMKAGVSQSNRYN